MLKSKKLIFTALAFLFAIGGAWNQSRMNGLRSDLGLTRRDQPLENAPPVLAFTTVALGGFRGVIANVLWMRAMRLQDEGRYFEITLLANWITKLQPYFGSVWTHQAWNMAYNISREFQAPSDRWLWVNSAIKLLRDEGIQYNPTEPGLYQELAWIFHDKMGKAWDDAHWYYKDIWATEMNTILGKNPNWELLLNPQTEEQRQLVERIRNEYHLDPEIMLEVDEHYGPLDWRLPDTHAIYWAYTGLKNCGDRNAITLYRAIWQSLIQAFKNGRIIVNQIDGTFDLGPNLDMTQNVNDAMLEMIEKLPDQRDYVRTAYRGFLSDATYFNYTHFRLTEAARWFNILKTEFPEAVETGEDVNAFAVRRVTESSTQNMARARVVIEGLLTSVYLNAAIGENEQADGLYALAQKIYDAYKTKITGEEERLDLGEFDEIKRQVVNDIFSEDSRFSDALKDQLRVLLPALAPPETSND